MDADDVALINGPQPPISADGMYAWDGHCRACMTTRATCGFPYWSAAIPMKTASPKSQMPRVSAIILASLGGSGREFLATNDSGEFLSDWTTGYIAEVWCCYAIYWNGF
jgi:hypothetical protein